MFEKRKLVRFHHCDPAGIVLYPQYFVLFNELVEDWFAEGLGTDFATLILKLRMGMPAVRVECDFLAPSSIGDRLTFRLLVKELGRSSVTLAASAHGPDGGERVRATLVHVLTSLETNRSQPFSDALRARIETFRS